MSATTAAAGGSPTASAALIDRAATMSEPKSPRRRLARIWRPAPRGRGVAAVQTGRPRARAAARRETEQEPGRRQGDEEGPNQRQGRGHAGKFRLHPFAPSRVPAAIAP